jgi:hypothetical protein
MTPLLPLPTFGAAIGVPRLLMKDEALIPTGTSSSLGQHSPKDCLVKRPDSRRCSIQDRRTECLRSGSTGRGRPRAGSPCRVLVPRLLTTCHWQS